MTFSIVEVAAISRARSLPRTCSDRALTGKATRLLSEPVRGSLLRVRLPSSQSPSHSSFSPQLGRGTAHRHGAEPTCVAVLQIPASPSHPGPSRCERPSSLRDRRRPGQGQRRRFDSRDTCWRARTRREAAVQGRTSPPRGLHCRQSRSAQLRRPARLLQPLDRAAHDLLRSAPCPLRHECAASR